MTRRNSSQINSGTFQTTRGSQNRDNQYEKILRQNLQLHRKQIATRKSLLQMPSQIKQQNYLLNLKNKQSQQVSPNQQPYNDFYSFTTNQSPLLKNFRISLNGSINDYDQNCSPGDKSFRKGSQNGDNADSSLRQSQIKQEFNISILDNHKTSQNNEGNHSRASNILRQDFASFSPSPIVSKQPSVLLQKRLKQDSMFKIRPLRNINTNRSSSQQIQQQIKAVNSPSQKVVFNNVIKNSKLSDFPESPRTRLSNLTYQNSPIRLPEKAIKELNMTDLLKSQFKDFRLKVSFFRKENKKDKCELEKQESEYKESYHKLKNIINREQNDKNKQIDIYIEKLIQQTEAYDQQRDQIQVEEERQQGIHRRNLMMFRIGRKYLKELQNDCDYFKKQY